MTTDPLAALLRESLAANALELWSPGCIQNPDEAVTDIATSLRARGVTASAPDALRAAAGHGYTCAYCTSTGGDPTYRPTWPTRLAYEQHHTQVHHGLPYEPPMADWATHSHRAAQPAPDKVPTVRESSARLGIAMAEHNAPDIVHPAPFEDDYAPEIEFDIASVTTPDGQVYRAHVPCCWCGEHHEEGN